MDDRGFALAMGTVIFYMQSAIIGLAIYIAKTELIAFLILLPLFIVGSAIILNLLKKIIGTIIHNDILWDNKNFGVKERKYFGIW